MIRKLEESGHIFEVSNIWENLYKFLKSSAKDSSDMLQGLTVFPDELLTKDEVYDELFREKNDLTFDTLTQECLKIICCTRTIMIQSQLKGRLPGGKYYSPSDNVLGETMNCPRTNAIGERDFAQYDQRTKAEE